jgi:hypothetical protein
MTKPKKCQNENKKTKQQHRDTLCIPTNHKIPPQTPSQTSHLSDICLRTPIGLDTTFLTIRKILILTNLEKTPPNLCII